MVINLALPRLLQTWPISFNLICQTSVIIPLAVSDPLTTLITWTQLRAVYTMATQKSPSEFLPEYINHLEWAHGLTITAVPTVRNKLCCQGGGYSRAMGKT